MREYKPGDLVVFTDTMIFEGQVGTIVGEMLRPSERYTHSGSKVYSILIDGQVEEGFEPDEDFVPLEEG